MLRWRPSSTSTRHTGPFFVCAAGCASGAPAAPCCASGMVLIDSSPWIDFFGGCGSVEARLLEQWLRDGRPVAISGVIIQEVLQGTRTATDFAVVRARVGRLPFLRADREAHVEAARLHRAARGRGWTVPAADALIAATALAHGASLLTSDREHFTALAKVSKLRLAE